MTSRPPRALVPPARGVPEATVARLPMYLRMLSALAERRVSTVSSEELAEAVRVTSAQLRRDLSHLGSYGTRGVGYDVETLRDHISQLIGLTQDQPVVIVGVGSLGRALANYSGFASRGFRVVGLLDADESRAGEVVNGVAVSHVRELEQVVEAFDVAIAVISTPSTAAQQVCDRLVSAGVTSVLNFAPVALDVPPGVDVRKIDLSLELQVLAYHVQRKHAALPIVHQSQRVDA